MKRFLQLAVVLMLFGAGSVEAGTNNTNEPLRGEIVDANTGESVPGATVQIEELNRGTSTDADGEFRFNDLPDGEYMLIARSVAHQEKKITISHPADGYLTIEIEPTVVRVDDVIVTASPFGRDVQYQSAQAFNVQNLQDRQASSFGEMLDGEPGIAMRSFGPAPSRPVIRGFDGDRLLILENGERMGDLSNTAHDHNISIDPLVADRVEVVRGPASLLYGSSALGGVVNIITSDIPRDWERGSSGTVALEGSSMNDGFGSFGRYQVGGDRWAATGRFSYRGADDLRTPAGRLPGTFIQNLEGSAGAAYRSDRFKGGFSFSAIDHNYGLPEEIDDPDEEAEIRMNQQSLQGSGQWTIGRFFDQIDFRMNASRLFQQEVELEFEDGGIDEDIELEFLQHAMNATVTARHQPFGVVDTGIVGMNTHIRQLDVGGDEAFTPGIDNRSVALFTFHEIPLSDITRLQFGVRGETHSLSTRPNDDFPGMNETRSSSALSGSVGLNVRPFSGFEVGGQIARAHRFPILEELYADGVHFGAGVYERGNSDLQTEVGLGSDLFVKWGNSRVRAEVAGYWYHISDYVAFEPTGETFRDSRNREWDIYEYSAHDARLLGGEAQITFQLTERLETGVSADYVRGSRLDSDSPLPTMPPLRYRVQTRYDTGRWWAGGNLRMVNSQKRVVDGELPTDGYTLLDFYSGIRFDQNGMHRISLRVDNVANTLYRDHLSRIDRTEFGSPMPGRNVRLSYRFMF
ncbi:MAG: TonB-dependent receptor [Balneolaceae bacterium]|nr:TonB-dependent receptor [Balneolaceae bacterium]